VRILRYWGIEALLGAAVLALALALVGYWGWHSGESLQTKVTHFFINVIFVVALQTFSGNSGILSFGHMAFVGVGAYTAALFTIDPFLKGSLLAGAPGVVRHHTLSFWPVVLLAAGVAGVVAVATAVPILRLDGASAVIAILSLLLIADVVFGSWTDLTNGGAGLYGIPPDATLGRTLAVAVVAVVVARLFRDSKTGLLLQGSREDAFSAASVGVPVRAYRARAWVLSAMLAGAGGALYAFWLGTAIPSAFFLGPTFALIVMFIVGGTATVGGAVLGAAVVTAVQEGVRTYEGNSFLFVNRLTGLTQFTLVVMILVVMYFRREGILGRLELDERLRRALR
jgi:branched-chain amino acid transport system ATP-binding protein/branched-chain amino acid transport system permease protein